MKEYEIHKAAKTYNELVEARERLKNLNLWEFREAPIFVSVDSKEIMLKGRRSFDDVKNALRDSINGEIKILEGTLAAYGVELI